MVMECPYCSGPTHVIDSRPADNAIRRRRKCQQCERRFTTFERIAELESVVVKRDGRRESFRREKLLTGLRLACLKRPIPTEELETLVEAVRQRAMRSGDAEVQSREIGEWVVERLQPLDAVAAFRFAAVFRCPTDTAALRRELAAVEAMVPRSDDGDGKQLQPWLPGLTSATPPQNASSNATGATETPEAKAAETNT